MKCVLVFITFLATWMTSSEAAKTCEEITSCASDVASMDRSKMNEACDTMRGALACIEEVIADCHVKQPDMMEQLKSAIQPSMDQLKSLINKNCAGVTSMEAAKTCEEMTSCTSGMATFASMDQSKMNETCDEMTGVMTCFEEVITDCRAKHPDMMEQQKSAIQPSMDQLKSLINKNCGSGAAGTAGSGAAGTAGSGAAGTAGSGAAGTATVSLGLLIVAFLVSLF